MNLQRRKTLVRTAALASLLTPWSASLLAQANQTNQTSTRSANPKALRLGERLRIFIPANPGGGWDQTGHALGEALQASGAVDLVEYENLGGKGGTLGLARYVEKYSDDPNALLIGGMVMVGAIALQKPAVDLAQVQPLARLTSDYLVAAVPTSSPLRSARDLSAAMQADLRAVPFAGGSAGGVDHMFAGMLARAAKARPETLVYRPFASGTEVANALVAGDAAVGISGYSEFSSALASGKLRAIGISSRKDAFGVPAFREHGLDAAMANWRGVFTGKGTTAARTADMVAAIEQATVHGFWQNTLRQNRWNPSWLTGKNLRDFMELDATTANAMVYLLKLKS